MGRYRKRPAWTAGVAATVALNGNPVIALELVAPVITVTTDAELLSTQRATNIRFIIGFFVK